MLRLSILLLLLSSEFQFGEFQKIKKPVKPIFKLIQIFKSFQYYPYGMKSITAETFRIMTDDFDSKIHFGLPYTLNELKDTLRMDNFTANKLENFSIKIDSSSALREIEQLQSKFALHRAIVNDAVSDIRGAFQRLLAFFDVVRKALVEKHYDKVLKSVEDIQMHLAPFEYEDKADEKKKMGLVELYELLTTKNILHRCGTGTSPQQVLLELYVAVMKTETVAMEALILLTSLKNVDDTVWTTLAKRFALRYNAYVQSFTRAFDKAAREHRSCDPDNGWERGISFFELERQQQLTTFHRSVSESRRNQWPNCNEWALQLVYKKDSAYSICEGPDSDACWMDPVEKCDGWFYDCYSANVTRCINGPNSLRRYSWINDMSSSKYSTRNTNCSGEGRHLNEGFGDTCICECSENGNKISLDMSFSNIKKNRVITAMRFAWKKKILFIQTKQGTLQSDNRITNESSSWEPSSPSQEIFNYVSLYPPGDPIYLDDLQGADDEVLTGIGFAKLDKYLYSGVKLQIRVTRFKYARGQLGDKSRFISASDRDRTRKKLKTHSPLDNQLENVATTSINDFDEKFIVFQSSDWMSDAGQTTVPLIDAVPVEGRPARPLSGAGLFHKKAANQGGFLSLRAIGLNLAKYFKERVGPIPHSLFASKKKSFKDIIKGFTSEWR